jgi:outer membrane immunogenic protein
VFVLFAGLSAHAADFKGFYAGFNIGGNSGHSDATTSTIFSPTGYFASTSVPAIAGVGAQSFGSNGIVGGGQAGYNFQHRRLVIGGEFDFGAMNLSQSATGSATYPCCAPTAFTVTQSVKTSWLVTVRPRVGFTGGPLFVYGTGGLAMTGLNYQAVFTDTFATAHENAGTNNVRTGWAAGGGAEVKVGHRWSVKGEYLRTDFGDVSKTSTNLTAFTPPIAFSSNVFTHTANLTGNVYRFGVNFHF